MKKKLLTLFLSVVACSALALGLTACDKTQNDEVGGNVGGDVGGNTGGNGENGGNGGNGGEVHTHENSNFQFNETSHWKVCKDCKERFDEGSHSFQNNTCTVCGYSTNFTKGLKYRLDEETDTYVVIGIGTATDTDLIIPAYYEGETVTGIGDAAFRDCSGLTSVTIGSGLTSIGSGAFEGCSSLTSITVPDSVTSIGYWAFGETAYYDNEANWQNGVLYIGKHLIKANPNISGSYTIKSDTLTIAASAFSECSVLTSITIPDSVMSIGEFAFSGCSGLTSVTIPDSVTSIGSGVFEGCSSLTSITIPDSVMSIGESAFSGCSGLTSVTIPDSVTSIGEGAISRERDIPKIPKTTQKSLQMIV